MTPSSRATSPYPYRTGEDEEEERLRGNIKAPVGKWRQIWSNTTYLVKTGFYNTFTGKNRLSAAEWAQVLREYARQIELGHSSDDLTPGRAIRIPAAGTARTQPKWWI